MKRLAGATALVTGGAGFVGSHLCAALSAEGAAVTPLGGRHVAAGLTDMAAITQIIDDVRPTHVFHLAGVRAAEPGGAAAQLTGNALPAAILVEALATVSPPVWLLIMSSSAVYGPAGETPLSEEAALEPATAYGVSKVAEELFAARYWRSLGGTGVVVRPFNIVGPGQPRGLLVRDIADQIVAAEQGGDPVVRIGNTSSKRDFVDVRDVARACVGLAAGEVDCGTFNIATGVAHSVKECLDILVAQAHRSVDVREDPGRRRAAELAVQVGSYARLRAATGWMPSITLGESLHSLLAGLRSEQELSGT